MMMWVWWIGCGNIMWMGRFWMVLMRNWRGILMWVKWDACSLWDYGVPYKTIRKDQQQNRLLMFFNKKCHCQSCLLNMHDPASYPAKVQRGSIFQIWCHILSSQEIWLIIIKIKIKNDLEDLILYYLCNLSIINNVI